MIKKMGLMALGLSMVLLSGCGSSDNDAVTNPTPPVVTPDPTPPGEIVAVFTPELLVGKTYVVIDGDEEETITFSETEISFTGNGETGSISYAIDGNGVLEVGGDGDFHYLISIDESGDLNVENDGILTVWVLIS